jgi:hypothetical protein
MLTFTAGLTNFPDLPFFRRILISKELLYSSMEWAVLKLLTSASRPRISFFSCSMYFFFRPLQAV